MNKIYTLILILIITFFNINTVKADIDKNIQPDNQDGKIFIPILKTDKLEYKVGDNIKSVVYIDNNSDYRKSDIYFTTTIVVKNNKGEDLGEFEYTKSVENVYLEAKSRKRIEFDHLIKTNINQDVELIVTAQSRDGAVLGQKTAFIKIQSSNPLEIVNLENIHIKQKNTEFSPFVGITVKKNEDIYFKFKTNKLSNEKIKVSPKINLYNKSTLTGQPLKQINSEDIILESNKEYSIKLPTDLDPLVYFGSIVFENNNKYIISDAYFKYIIEGKIGSILNANSSNLDVNKDDIVKINIEYGGRPPILNDTIVNNSQDSFESLIDGNYDYKNFDENENNSTSTIEQVNKILPENLAYINIYLINSDKEIIGQGKIENIDLLKNGIVTSDIKVNKKSKGFTIKAEMFSSDNTLLSEYVVDLPSESKLQEQYGFNKNNLNDYIVKYKIIITIILLILLSIISLLYIKFRNKKVLYISILFALIIASMTVYVLNAKAYTIHVEQTQENKANYFKLNSIISPAPAESLSYAPGEAFKLEINASFVNCTNDGFEYYLHGPDQDWTNFDFNLDELNSIFVWNNYNYKDYVGGNSTGLNVRKRYIEWFTTPKNQILSAGQGGKTKGFMNPNQVRGKGGQLLVKATNGKTAYSYKDVGNNTAVRSYMMNSGSVTYYMPQTPGYHNFYFMLTNSAGGGTLQQTKIISQRVCVRGAGICNDEKTLKLGTLPNSIFADNIGSTNADINWSYSNAPTKTQQEYIIDISKNEAFTATSSISDFQTIKNAVGEIASTTRKRFVDLLTPDTNYFARIRIRDEDGWSGYVKTSFKTLKKTGCTCSDNRTQICTNEQGITISTPNGCKLNASCLSSTGNSTDGTTYNVYVNNLAKDPSVYVDDILNTTYTKDLGPANNIFGEFNFNYKTNFVPDIIQKVNFTIKDAYDGQEVKLICAKDNTKDAAIETGGGTTQPGQPNVILKPSSPTQNTDNAPSPLSTTTPLISITKTPSIILNKGGKCKIAWDIKNMPAATTCTVKDDTGATLKTISLDNDGTSMDSYTSNSLTSNKKFIINCSGVNLSPSITDNAICRVEPKIIEN